MEKLQIKYLADITKIAKITKGDWIDLRAADTIEMKKGEFRLIPLGVAIKLPAGYEALVAPRSSTFKNYGILQTNSIGVIDETYCGNGDQWLFPAFAMRDVIIHKDERICQFRIIEHQPALDIEEVDDLGDVNRGGIGSTGVK